jgi:hypothetical protein
VACPVEQARWIEHPALVLHGLIQIDQLYV